MTVLAFAASGLTPVVATAEPSWSVRAFDEFRAVCLRTSASPTAVLIADQRGWAQLPEDRRRLLASGVQNPRSFRGRLLRVGDKEIVLSTRQSLLKAGGDQALMSSCQMIIAPAEYSTLSHLARAWAAVPSIAPPEPDTAIQFVFEEKDGRRIPIAGAQANQPLTTLRGRRLTKLIVAKMKTAASLTLIAVAG